MRRMAGAKPRSCSRSAPSGRPRDGVLRYQRGGGHHPEALGRYAVVQLQQGVIKGTVAIDGGGDGRRTFAGTVFEPLRHEGGQPAAEDRPGKEDRVLRAEGPARRCGESEVQLFDALGQPLRQQQSCPAGAAGGAEVDNSEMLLHKNDPFRDGKCKDSITLRGRGCNLLSDQTSPAAPAADPGADQVPMTVRKVDMRETVHRTLTTMWARKRSVMRGGARQKSSARSVH